MTPRRSEVLDPWPTELATKDVDTYHLDEYVGRGRIGVVYRAHDLEIPDRQVAVKLVKGLKSGWENELKKVAKLTTIPAVVQFHTLGTCRITHNHKTDLFQYTVWDYIAPGRSLKRYLSERGTTSTSFLFAVIEQILLVLHACERRGVARHGDLHAGNVLVGEPDDANLDDALQPRQPIFVSDFGYGTTGGAKQPKDDYRGLAEIGNAILHTLEWEAATATDRQRATKLRELLTKLLQESESAERRSPLEILRVVQSLRRAQPILEPSVSTSGPTPLLADDSRAMTVGQFPVSEMLGDEWPWWKRLFVPNVPARSRILEADIPTVVTGPRGCGKTMLFRRLSERLVLECGPIDEATPQAFAGFYINANDIADAFPFFPSQPTPADAARVICYANLCILSDFLAVISTRDAKRLAEPPKDLLAAIHNWLLPDSATRALLAGESPLERYRSLLEAIKWRFATHSEVLVTPGLLDLARHDWLPYFLRFARGTCEWLGNRRAFLFVDDYSMPRVSGRLQQILNRLLFQRSSEFIAKIATESATTFLAEDSSGKLLQDGDDYQLIDLAEETLAMDDVERLRFLTDVFARRLALDKRVSTNAQDLAILLGRLGLSKTEFARRLRQPASNLLDRPVASRRRGATRARALYFGVDVFEALWSGDTRIMIQLIQELLDEVTNTGSSFVFPLASDLQDRVFRNRGGFWLEAQRRNQPTDRESLQHALDATKAARPKYALTGGSYGSHLKAIVEAFVQAARRLLRGPTYRVREDGRIREVPRMAFRLEIVDEFRLGDLATEIYKDLIRYGLFLRDSRGKSIRGAMVPRLYLRRFLLPYCTLALSKRDSVPVKCREFEELLVTPDVFRTRIDRRRAPIEIGADQGTLFQDDGVPPRPHRRRHGSRGRRS